MMRLCNFSADVAESYIRCYNFNMRAIITIITAVLLLFPLSAEETFAIDLESMSERERNTALFQLGLEAVLTDACPSAVLYVGDEDRYIGGYLSPQTRFDYCSVTEPGTVAAIQEVPKDFAIGMARLLDDIPSVTALMEADEAWLIMISMFTPEEGMVFEPVDYVLAKRKLEMEAVRNGFRLEDFEKELELNGIEFRNAVMTILSGVADEREIVADVLRMKDERVEENRIADREEMLEKYIRYQNLFLPVVLGVAGLIALFSFMSWRSDRKSFSMEEDEEEEAPGENTHPGNPVSGPQG